MRGFVLFLFFENFFVLNIQSSCLHPRFFYLIIFTHVWWQLNAHHAVSWMKFIRIGPFKYQSSMPFNTIHFPNFFITSESVSNYVQLKSGHIHGITFCVHTTPNGRTLHDRRILNGNWGSENGVEGLFAPFQLKSVCKKFSEDRLSSSMKEFSVVKL